jgi:very-short-patch-repair endonuclease
VYRGVYAVGNPKLTLDGRWMAAVLACGPKAVLSHGDAAALWGLQRPPSGAIHVTAPTNHTHAGIRCHVALLRRQDRTRIDGIPVTSLNRTLLDRAAVLGPQRLRSTLEAAQRRGILDVRALRELIAASAGRRGVARLARAFAELHDEAPSMRSPTEVRLLELIRAAGLPEPQCNVVVHGEVVDFYWPQYRLVVEADGWGSHRSKRSFEGDRNRDTKLAIARIQTARFTADRIKAEPALVQRDLVGLIRSAAA